MTHPYSPPPHEDKPQGFSYEPGGIAPVTGAPYPEGMGFVTPAQRPRRPGTVTAAIVLLWVLAGLAVLVTMLIGLLLLLTAVQPPQNPVGRGGVLAGILIVVLLLVYAALMMVSAIRLPKKADSARVLALTLMGFFVFSNLTYIVFTLGTFGRATAANLGGGIIVIFASLLAGAMPAVIIVLLSLKKSVTWFYDKSTDIR